MTFKYSCGRAFSGPVLADEVSLILGRYKGVRIRGVQGAMLMVDTVSAKVKFCGVTPDACTAWKE